MELTRVSSKGQVVIPKPIRLGMKLNEGDWIAVETVKDLVVMKKVSLPDKKRLEERLDKEDLEKLFDMEELLYPER